MTKTIETEKPRVTTENRGVYIDTMEIIDNRGIPWSFKGRYGWDDEDDLPWPYFHTKDCLIHPIGTDPTVNWFETIVETGEDWGLLSVLESMVEIGEDVKSTMDKINNPDGVSRQSNIDTTGEQLRGTEITDDEKGVIRRIFNIQPTTCRMMKACEDIPEIDDLKVADLGGAVGEWKKYALYFVPNERVQEAQELGAELVSKD